MAVPDISPENSFTRILYDLLRRARSIKRSTAIDPPLQVSALFDNDDNPISAPTASDKDAHNYAVESAAKSIFYANLVSQ
jgi:THO complex subunit 1